MSARATGRTVFIVNFEHLLTTQSLQSSRPELFCKKGVLRNFAKFTGKHLPQACEFIKKESLAQVFFCEICEIYKNTFFYRTPPVAAWWGLQLYSKETLCEIFKDTLYLQITSGGCFCPYLLDYCNLLF